MFVSLIFMASVTAGANASAPDVIGTLGRQTLSIDHALSPPAQKNATRAAIRHALVVEAAEKYGVSAEPELDAEWGGMLAMLTTTAKYSGSLEDLPNDAKLAIRETKARAGAAILAKKVSDFITVDLLKSDKEFASVFSLQSNGSLRTNTNNAMASDTLKLIAFRQAKIRGWWVRFMGQEQFHSEDPGCKAVFEEYAKEGMN